MSIERWTVGIVVGILVGGGLTACSASPESQEGAAGTERDGLVVRPPFCGYPQQTSGTITWSPQACMLDGLRTLSWRGFNATTFEQTLAKTYGCRYGLADGSGAQVRAYAVSGYSVTACPDSCALEELLWETINAHNPDGTPIAPYLSRERPWSCLPTAPAGIVYVEWDPHCPGGCPLVEGGT